MLSFLKKHPFPVEAYFDSSTVLAFAFPKEKLQPFIPECLELDLFQDQWAFVAVAMVQTKNLRPKGFPTFMGNDFFLIGYRIFVRFTDQRGKRFRGLFILRSETDKLKMRMLGNIFTHYNYHQVNIQQKTEASHTKIWADDSNFFVRFAETPPDVEVALPNNSPFDSWKEAKRFAGPLPFTFTYKPTTQEVLIIEGVRQNWKPSPIQIADYTIPFLDDLGLTEATLANAFVIKNVPYYWKKGRIEPWKP